MISGHFDTINHSTVKNSLESIFQYGSMKSAAYCHKVTGIDERQLLGQEIISQSNHQIRSRGYLLLLALCTFFQNEVDSSGDNCFLDFSVHCAPVG